MAAKGSKKYGLILNNKVSSSKRVIKNTNVLGDESDNEDDQKRVVNASILQESFKKHQRKQVQLELDRAKAEDPTVFEYDSIYDELENKKVARNPAVITDRKPKYIASLMKSAELRKREYERMTERKIQKEREAEGDKFQDKEAFVTAHYKEKMLELAKEEERIKQQDRIDELNDVKKQSDLSGFYRHLLNNTLAKEETSVSRNTIKSKAEDKDAIDNQQHTNQSRDSSSSKPRNTDDKQRYRSKAGDNSGDDDATEYSDHSKYIDRQDNDHMPNKVNDMKRNIDDIGEAESSRSKFSKQDKSSEVVQEEANNKKNDTIATEVSSETKQTVFDRRNVTDTVSAARERYLARKKAKDSVKAIFDDDTK
ncbi:Nuclear speckle splicing regulatory protein 1 [Trichoplax sp. H2]|uniref:Nuclear speckle splicing regulatory protein 1 N-terminal domain-containing protein n=1 Tax=Trichoplax adhaerens TaxID=10228 RepID=B3S4B1_TRIAD|nr:hypothetical protein TRIADDRAFT_59020 [Trichoplax adhaerens]EDV22429.1 hypothetical protein TRIADDRAFT_59020 [Trichoplax adhaerens]RDD40988.1 Nuclear speckle splicing regulatory protein 1 [Trichoplax sp. H2]|eukprot:XP_002114973.1 hypothetical protein TRIADDRAFT_59020 [Trichoplax adhaerens]